MRNKYTVIVLLILGLTIATFPNLHAEVNLPYSDWFILKSASTIHWELIPDPSDKMQFSIKPREIQGEQKKILVLFPKKSSAYDTAMETILGVFYEKNIPAFFKVINFANVHEEGMKALEFAEKNGFDLIISMGSGSTKFCYENYWGGKLPVVSVCAKDPVLLKQMPDYEHGSGTNIAFTSLDMSAELHMIYLKKLKGNLKNIAIMYARNNWSAVTTQAMPLKRLAESEDINVLEVVVEDQKNARIELEEKVPLTVEEIKKSDPEMRNSLFWITGSTSVFREIETINKHSEKIPVLSVVPDVVQEGDASAVLSVGVGFENNALKAALYVVDILQGRVAPGDLKVGVITPPDIAINFKKAKKIGLTIPFSFFESATSIYDYDGAIVRYKGRNISQHNVE